MSVQLPQTTSPGDEPGLQGNGPLGAGSIGRSSIKHPHHSQFSLCCRSFLPENKIGKTALIYFSRMNKDMTVTGVMKRWEPIIHISHTPRWSRLSQSNNLSLFSSSVAEESWLPWLASGHEGLSRRETRSRGGRRRVFKCLWSHGAGGGPRGPFSFGIGSPSGPWRVHRWRVLLGVLACGSITESKGCPAAAEDRWAPIANRWNLFFVDQYSKTKIVGQWREEAEPCQERS